MRSQLEKIEQEEQTNQAEQEQVSQRIAELEQELQQQQKRRDELDQRTLRLYAQAEELRPKLDKLERIASLSQEFLELHNECQDSQDLLSTLYSSISAESIEENKRSLMNSPLFKQQPASKSAKSASSDLPDKDYSDYSISIDEIRDVLPNAEIIYQKLVANNLEAYKTYQNYIVEGLDMVWYAVAFVAFGRSAYRKMGFKYHPDLDGSEQAMQLINTAWSISQKYLKDLSNDELNTL
ncbi:MAG: molecular chaperone DnaJ [Cyanobacteria bacterium J06621_8]